MRHFQVRNITESEDTECYDVVFHDHVNGFLRYSPDVYYTQHEAEKEANRLEIAKPQEEHYNWDIAHTIDKN